MRNLFLSIVLVLAYCLVCRPVLAGEEATAEMVKRNVEFMKKMDDADLNKSEELNEKLDKIWEEFGKAGEIVWLMLKGELEREIAKQKPSQFFLLDVATFLAAKDLQNSYEVSFAALGKIDSKSKIIQANFTQLFKLFGIYAREKEKRLLPLIIQTFMKDNGRTVEIFTHSLTLDSVQATAFLLGPYEEEAENLIDQFLRENPSSSILAIEILQWVGSEKSFPIVKELFISNRNDNMFKHCVKFFLTMCGKEGRDYLLTVDTEKYDGESKKYYQEILPKIKGLSFDKQKEAFPSFPGEAKIPDDQLKKALSEMSKDPITSDLNPMTVLNSTLPKDFLIKELRKIRAKSFYTVSDEALSNVEITNSLINILHYREK